jgi:solute:Na+ symporter, SSS family
MRALDIAVILVYMIGVVWAGIASRGKRDDVEEFFTAKGRFRGAMGSVLIGLSMAATLFSGISFIAYTSTAYSDGIRIVLGVASFPIVWMVLRYWFLPRYLAGSGSHPYDIVERRLGSEVRLCISAMFVLLRLGWMAVMLVAPTLVIMGAGGLGNEWFWPLVVLTGVTCTFYTAIGGIRGVIITDAIQFAVIALGIVFIMGFIYQRLGLTTAEIYRQLDQAGRLHLLDFSLSLTQPFTFWGVLIGLTFINLGNHIGDFMMLQRYLAGESPRSVARSLAINMWGAAGIVVTLVAVGLLLWVWYRNHPDPHLPKAADQMLPYFIARELPAGMSGLLIASILAATMSSMTSGIIALGGTVTNDWVRRFGRARSAAELLGLGRWISVSVGIVSTAAAAFANNLGTLFQISQVVLGSFLGPMLGCMVIVVGPWNVRPRAVLAGILLGTATGWLITASKVSVIWVSCGSALVALAIPLIFRPGPKSLTPNHAQPVEGSTTLR